LTPLERFDESLRARHKVECLIGIDEAGRGPLAGPVVAAAVWLPRRPLPELEPVRDSKKLSPARREEAFTLIRRVATGVGVGWALRKEIDDADILQATLSAMKRALSRVRPPVVPWGGLLVLVDGNRRIKDLDLPQQTLVSGDARSLCVACGSVVAKVVRDRWMRVLARRHPGYGFEQHKGYATQAHYEALQRLGPSPEHRLSFLRNFFEPSLPL